MKLILLVMAKAVFDLLVKYAKKIALKVFTQILKMLNKKKTLPESNIVVKNYIIVTGDNNYIDLSENKLNRMM